MINWQPSAVAFYLGHWPIYWYGIITILGVAVTYIIALKLAPRLKVPAIQLEKLLAWALVGGVVGARLANIIFFEPGYYLNHLNQVWQLRLGGSSIFGAIGGVLLAIFIYARRHDLNWLSLVDVGALAAPLGQAIGRWGNFFNQELYGRPTTKPWGIFIDPVNRLPGYEAAAYFHPVFLYECLLNIILFVLLFFYVKKNNHRPGQVFSLYLVGYGLIRLALEWWRIDPAIQLGPLRSPQWLALIMILAGGIYWLKKQRLKTNAAG